VGAYGRPASTPSLAAARLSVGRRPVPLERERPGAHDLDVVTARLGRARHGRYATAIGLRQMFPVQTKTTFTTRQMRPAGSGFPDHRSRPPVSQNWTPREQTCVVDLDHELVVATDMQLGVGADGVRAAARDARFDRERHRAGRVDRRLPGVEGPSGRGSRGNVWSGRRVVEHDPSRRRVRCSAEPEHASSRSRGEKRGAGGPCLRLRVEAAGRLLLRVSLGGCADIAERFSTQAREPCPAGSSLLLDRRADERRPCRSPQTRLAWLARCKSSVSVAIRLARAARRRASSSSQTRSRPRRPGARSARRRAGRPARGRARGWRALCSCCWPIDRLVRRAVASSSRPSAASRLSTVSAVRQLGPRAARGPRQNSHTDKIRQEAEALRQ